MMELWPFTNFHDLNLDWIIKKIRNVEDSEAAAKASEEAAAEYADDAKGYMLDARSEKVQAAIFSSRASNSASDAEQSATSIAGVVNQVNTNTSRINNLVANAGDTDNNAELLDIRVGYMGKTYTAAGDAVRGQATDISTMVRSLCEEINPDVYQGTINSVYGTVDGSSTTRVYADYMELTEPIIMLIPAEYDYNIFFYAGRVEDDIDVFLTPSTGWLNGQHIIGEDIAVPAGAILFRVIFRYTNNATITPADLSGYYILKRRLYDIPEEMQHSLTPCAEYMCRDARSTNLAPPDSKYAIAETVKNQYDRIRFSVAKTTDDYMVCVHDVTINDLAVMPDGTAIPNTVITEECSLAELNQYDWGLKYGSRYAGMRVPELEYCLEWAAKYNISIALDFKWQLTETEIITVCNLLAKYGLSDALFMGVSLRNMQTIQNYDPFASFLFASTSGQLTDQATYLKTLHNSMNKIYVAYRPMGSNPPMTYIQTATRNGFNILYSPVEGAAELEALDVDIGNSMIECHYISKVKNTAISIADSQL